MADYYKTGGTIYPTKDQTKEKGDHKSNVLAWTSFTLGILSVVILILLNATNIALLIKKDQLSTTSNGKPGMTSEMGDKLTSMIEDDVIPKTNLINNMVSYQIPTSLTQIYNLIKRDVLQTCTPKFDYGGTQCPVSSEPFHSGSFSLINRNFLQRCPDPNNNLGFKEQIKLVDYPSFIPGPTRPGGCSRDPSFGISSKIFAYTHNVVPTGCDDIENTMQYFSIGRVTDVNADMPFFETLTQWYLDDGLNRKSCTVAPGDEGSWIMCIITRETEEQDYRNLGIGRVYIGYLDIYGRKKSWYLEESEITFDLPMAAMYFSGGSGVVSDGKVHVLIYGGLVAPVSGNVYCKAPGCDNPDQETCNKASMPKSLSERQLINGVFSFSDDPTESPKPVVKMIHPSVNWVGARGRIFDTAYENIFFIYISSNSWHSLPKTGMMVYGDDISIQWVENVAVSRPGPEKCMYGNRCPQECLGAPYTDIFPIDSVFQFGVSVILKSYQVNKNPVITIMTQNKIISETEVTNDHHGAQYTTTSCFKYSRSMWCLSIIAFEPATVGERAPVPILYKVPIYCKVASSKTNIVTPHFINATIADTIPTQELYPPEVPKIQDPNKFNEDIGSIYHFERPGTTRAPTISSRIGPTSNVSPIPTIEKPTKEAPSTETTLTTTKVQTTTTPQEIKSTSNPTTPSPTVNAENATTSHSTSTNSSHNVTRRDLGYYLLDQTNQNQETTVNYQTENNILSNEKSSDEGVIKQLKNNSKTKTVKVRGRNRGRTDNHNYFNSSRYISSIWTSLEDFLNYP
ncbi:cell attachment protein [Meliandou lophuromys virus]|uniref:Cell attachment protein n=1 Tax=Meliandou lophuromys virus TaxID=2940986 RepID=A0AAE9HWL6_9MONO|nr:cell attachment protein [Meliandou lophuromys virus]